MGGVFDRMLLLNDVKWIRKSVGKQQSTARVSDEGKRYEIRGKMAFKLRESVIQVVKKVMDGPGGVLPWRAGPLRLQASGRTARNSTGTAQDVPWCPP